MDETVFNRHFFWRSALRLAVPIALQNLLVNSFSMVDTIMVSQLGDVDLSASGMASQWSTLATIIIFGLCSGLSMFTAQYWGVNNRRDIRRMSGITLAVSMLSALLFMLPGAIIPEKILFLFNKDPAIIASGATYLRIVVWSYPALVLFNVFCTLLRSTECVYLPLIVSGLTTLGNVFFNYGLIFGHFGFPRLDIAGAAIATCISTWLGPILLLVLAAVRKNFLLTELREYVRFTREQLREFCRRAMPVLINETLWGIGSFLYSVIFSNMGYQYSAAVTIFKSVDSLLYSLFIGFCTACCIMVGKSIGAGRIDRGMREASRFVLLMPAMAAVVGVFVALCRHPLVGLFNLTGNLSEETLGYAYTALLIYAFALPLRLNGYIQIVGVFRSGGDTRMAAVFDIVAVWCAGVPMTFLAAFVFHLPFPLVFACMVFCEDLLKTPLCFAHFFRKKWIRPVTPEGKAGAAAYFAAQKKNKF